MIHRLSIQGLAIIDQLSIELSPGFNVITGETGAGKSILIRALNFLTGGRVGAEAIRKGAEQAVVQGEFFIPASHPAVKRLEGLGIPIERDGERWPLLLRRQISAKGRSQAWINDLGVTTAALRDVGRLLVDVFAQHENQRLLDPALHVGYLDEFVAVAEARAAVESAFGACQEILDAIRARLDRYRSGEQNRDYLEFRMEELRKFNPEQTDYDGVAELCQTSRHSVRLSDMFQKALGALDEDGGVGARLWRAQQALTDIPGVEGELAKTVQELKDRLASAATEVDDLSFELSQFLGKVDVDEQALEAAQERLYGYQKLFRKHGVSEIKDLLSLYEELKADLCSLDQVVETLEEALGELQDAIGKLTADAARLTKARHQAATLIKKSVEKELQELSMKGAKFEVEFASPERPLPDLDFAAVDPKLATRWEEIARPLSRVGRGGAEEVQFLLSANPGEPVMPLAKVASGGEISRIMLALKKALTVDADTCVLVFDEIDTGISGRVADVVGRKMSELSASFQVLCISHLPQVAVYADSHFLVMKEGKRNRTESRIVRLSKQESEREIARLLSGDELSDHSLKNARALLAQASGKKKTASPRATR